MKCDQPIPTFVSTFLVWGIWGDEWEMSFNVVAPATKSHLGLYIFCKNSVIEFSGEWLMGVGMLQG